MGELWTFVVGLVVVLAIVFALLRLGYWLARGELAEDREVITQQRQTLDIEWQALENARRVTDVFFYARRAMQDEMRRSEHGQQP